MNKVILYVIFIFAVLGCLDKVTGNKFGLGKKFDEGFMAMGNLSLAIIGIYALAPVLTNGLSRVITPIFSMLGADPSIFPASILACDMGGYISSVKIAQTKELGLFSGLILSSMLGATTIFTIPIGAGTIEKEDYPFFTKGILAGMVTIPIGCIVGGMMSGISFQVLLPNLLPIIIMSSLLGIGLTKWPNKMISAFRLFSKIIVITGAIGLIISILHQLTGITLLKGMEPFTEGLKIVGSIVVVLAGAYPMMHVITKMLKGPLSILGNRIGIGEKAVAGIIIALANNIPAFILLKDMDDRGKIICSAFAVSGAFTFGGQLGFVASIDQTMIAPFVLAKLTAGISAVALAFLLTRDMQELHNASVYRIPLTQSNRGDF